MRQLVEHRASVVAVGTAGLAVGFVGGMVAAEVVDEVGDFFESDEGGATKAEVASS